MRGNLGSHRHIVGRRLELSKKILRLFKRAAKAGIRDIAELLPVKLIEKLSDIALEIRIQLQEIHRRKKARLDPFIEPSIYSDDGDSLSRLILEKDEPWRNITPARCCIPAMLTLAERQYLQYIGKFYEGKGEVVEVGSWLGGSTYYLVSGLTCNQNFKNKRLYVFDDFVWRSAWMDKWLVGTSLSPPKNHESFEKLFESQVGQILQKLEVSRGKLCDYDGNENLQKLQWIGKKIEIIFVDCGRSFEVNQAWWKIFSPYFIPNHTLIIMQDWQCYKRVPEIWWENTKIFTDSKFESLDLIHELRDATLATFLFCG